MKTCTICNLSYDDNKKFCKKCGSPLVTEYLIDPKNIGKKTVLEDKLKADPLNLELLHEYAQFLFNNLLFKEATTVVFKILAINENDELAKDLLFKSYSKLNMNKEALEIGNQLLLESPTNVFILEELARILNELGDAAKSIGYYDKILRLQPENKSALHNKALNILNKNQLEQAIEIFKITHLKGQNDSITKIYVGIDKALNADYDAAIDLLVPALIEENRNLRELDKARGFLYLAYCLCQTKADIQEISKWVWKIDFGILKNNYHIFDEKTEAKIILHITTHKLNEISANINSKDNINNLEYKYYLDDSYFTKNSNLIIAEIWYNFGIKRAECKLYSDSLISFKKTLDLMPDENKYKKKYAEIKNLFENKKHKRERNTIFAMGSIFVAIIIIIIAVVAYKNYEENKSWKLANSVNTYSSYQDYLNLFPNGKHLEKVINLQEEALWKEALTTNEIQLFDNYISLFGNGKYIKEAYDKKEEALWIKSKQNNSYSSYFAQYPNGKHTIEAVKFNEQTIWSVALKKNTLEAYSNYLSLFPNGTFTRLANERVKALTPKKIILDPGTYTIKLTPGQTSVIYQLHSSSPTSGNQYNLSSPSYNYEIWFTDGEKVKDGANVVYRWRAKPEFKLYSSSGDLVTINVK